MAKILSVEIVHETDTCPDLSYLGEYSNKPGEAAIDRQERGDMMRGEYRYFNPAMTGEESGNSDSPVQDYLRMESYNNGQWYCLGISARARVQVAGDIVQIITSGGLWGIESDTDKDEVERIEKEQLSELAEQLEAIGFTTKQWQAAFRDIKRND